MRPDGSGSGAWACGSCHRVHAQTRGSPGSAGAANRERAEACCVPRICRFCGRPTQPDVLGDFPSAHPECLAEAVREEEPHPTMADPWARLLFRRMSEISEECYYARWRFGNEYTLWRMLEGGSRQYGQGEVSEEELEELRVLSERVNGWIWTGETEEYLPRLVTFDEWAPLLAKAIERWG